MDEYCCAPFEQCVERAGKAGLSIVLKEGEAMPYFSIQMTEPMDGLETWCPWVDVAGTAIDEVGPVRVTVNAKRTDGMSPDGGFWYRDLALQQGPNQITVRAEDEAGHVTELIINVLVDIGDDPGPPTSSLNFSGWTSGTIYVGDLETMFLHGTTDDSHAEIAVTVSAGDVTRGPFPVSNWESGLWAEIPLEPGENAVELISTDDAGNGHTVSYTVNRQTGTEFRITSHQPFEVLNDLEITASGDYSANLSGATFSINGVADSSPGATSFASDTAYFLTNPDVHAIEAVAEKDGIQTRHMIPVIGYQFWELKNIITDTSKGRVPPSGQWSNCSARDYDLIEIDELTWTTSYDPQASPIENDIWISTLNGEDTDPADCDEQVTIDEGDETKGEWRPARTDGTVGEISTAIRYRY